MNIGTQVLLYFHETLQYYYAFDVDMWREIRDNRGVNPNLDPSHAANGWKLFLQNAQIFYFENSLSHMLPDVLGDEPFIEPALPFDHGIMVYDMHGLGHWDSSFKQENSRLPTVTAWATNPLDNKDLHVWTMHLFHDRSTNAIGAASGGWPAPENQLVIGEDFLLAEVLRLILSKKTSTFRVRPDHDGSFKIAARTAELNKDGEGPHIVTLRALAGQYRDIKSYREVDWKSRWWVRGHIRHLQNGNITMVKPHIKGPKDRPLIQTIYDARR